MGTSEKTEVILKVSINSNPLLAESNNRIFEKPVGPWPTPMWQLEIKNWDHSKEGQEKFYLDLGLSLSWLMLNRDKFSVMVHPNTKKMDSQGGDLRDHTDYTCWLGKSYELKIELFKKNN